MFSASEDLIAFNPSGVPANVGPFDAVVIGASFGGPKAVERILKAVPKYFPVPIAVCQHITPGMTEAWAERLNRCCNIRVHEASDRAAFEPGHAYIAPAGLQMRVEKGSGTSRMRLDPDFADSLHVPSVDILFSSAAKSFGSCVLAVLLTGLGTDGSIGMLTLRRAGAYTIGESEETAASYSMPGSAAELGAVVQQLPLDRIPERIVELGLKR